MTKQRGPLLSRQFRRKRATGPQPVSNPQPNGERQFLMPVRVLDELATFLGKRRLTPITGKGEAYGTGFADGVKFALDSVNGLRKQAALKAAKAANG